MTLKKITPIERTIDINNETIRQLKLQNQELSALLPKRKVPDKRDLFITHPFTGKRTYFNRR